jgi:hypothetical protein
MAHSFHFGAKPESLQDVQKAVDLTRPTPARRDAPLLEQGRSEVHDVKNNERHVCGRRRVGEAAGVL